MSIETFKEQLAAHSVNAMFYDNAVIRRKCEGCQVTNLAEMLAYSENFIYSVNLSPDKGQVLLETTEEIILNELKKSEVWEPCFVSPYIDIYFNAVTAGIKGQLIVLKYVNKLRNHNIRLEPPISEYVHAQDVYYDIHKVPRGKHISVDCPIKVRDRVRYNFSLRFDCTLSTIPGVYTISCCNTVLDEETLEDVTEVIEPPIQNKLSLTLDFLKAIGALNHAEVQQIASGEPLRIERAEDEIFANDAIETTDIVDELIRTLIIGRCNREEEEDFDFEPGFLSTYTTNMPAVSRKPTKSQVLVKQAIAQQLNVKSTTTNVILDEDGYHKKGSVVWNDSYMTIWYCGTNWSDIVFWVEAKEVPKNGCIKLYGDNIYRLNDKIEYHTSGGSSIDYGDRHRMYINYHSSKNPSLVTLHQIVLTGHYYIFENKIDVPQYNWGWDNVKDKKKEFQIALLVEESSDSEIIELINSL